MTEYIPPALLNHLWQSTLFAALAAALALTLRKNHARVRYALWLAASLKFLVPFSVLVSVGTHLGWSGPPVSRASVLAQMAQQASQPFVVVERGFSSTAPAPGPDATVLPSILLAFWMCSCLAILFSWFVRWRRMRAAVRASTPLLAGPEAETLARLQQRMGISKPIALASTTTAVEPGIFGIFRPVLLLPAGISHRLAAAEMESVLVHELCHVRRRDNLTSAIHMLVEAIFWFHPLVWWLGARLVEERERACDEEVLRLGNDPEAYAESILKTCQFYLEPPIVCMSGITGSDLKKRVIRIMTEGIAHKLSPTKKILLATFGIAAIAVPIWFGILNPQRGRAQTPPANGTPTPKFEVASIKPSKPSSGDHGLFRMGLQPNGRFTGSVTVKFLLELAYGFKDSQISGGPGWIDSDRYDIEAKPDEAFAALTLSTDERFEQVRLMMQALLADRFKLNLRHETKELPVYALVVAKNGPKLKESAPEPGSDSAEPPPPRPGGPPPRGAMQVMPGQLNGNAISVQMLVDPLSHMTGRIVVDKTGLKGRYDFTLKWTPGEAEGPIFRGGPAGPPPPDAPPPPDRNGPTLFVAVQEQLGLKLESQKEPVDTVVIEHIERPTEN